jgi:hypothetical protein
MPGPMRYGIQGKVQTHHIIKRGFTGHTNNGDHLAAALVDDDLNAFYQHILRPRNVLRILVSSFQWDFNNSVLQNSQSNTKLLPSRPRFLQHADLDSSD